ncbi:TetR/AcrR family transcriptional regulator [Aliiroseovarius crassostreae]|uniref:TetR/AcrR family transcriptional regulator n=1 Tax=Aliiroseovarius crassostreae TaxID=154981 RepID=UPI003C7A1813
MAKLAERKAEKRRLILVAAEEVFLSEGYLRANMNRIAELAGVTKQTVYRYFPSKTELFRATLEQMGTQTHADLFAPLDLPDTRQALTEFAIGFMRAHMSESHLATQRLLIAEAGQAPEMVSVFFAVGPGGTQDRLKRFFVERLGVADPDMPLRLWFAMLLSPRNDALLHRGRLDETGIVALAEASVEMLCAGIGALPK